MISSGLDSKDITSCDLWWNGPRLLQEEIKSVENCLELSNINDFKKNSNRYQPDVFLLKKFFLDNVLNSTINFVNFVYEICMCEL